LGRGGRPPEPIGGKAKPGLDGRGKASRGATTKPCIDGMIERSKALTIAMPDP
jgi:hypothetical protein